MNRRAGNPVTLPAPRLSLAILLVFATLGTLLGLVAAGDNVLSVDVSVLEAIQRIDLPGTATLVRVANTAFDTVGALALGLLFLLAVLVLHRRMFAIQLVVVIVLRMIGQVLKPIFDSPRPGVEFQPDPSLVSSSMGYPSGHAYTATVITFMLVVFIHSLEVPRWGRVASIVVAVILTLIAMFARVWVGAHWPTDTVGGVCFGIATVALMQLIVGIAMRRRSAGG